MKDIICVGILVTAAVVIAVLRTYEMLVFKPIVGRGFRLRGQ